MCKEDANSDDSDFKMEIIVVVLKGTYYKLFKIMFLWNSINWNTAVFSKPAYRLMLENAGAAKHQMYSHVCLKVKPAC